MTTTLGAKYRTAAMVLLSPPPATDSPTLAAVKTGFEVAAKDFKDQVQEKFPGLTDKDVMLLLDIFVDSSKILEDYL